MFNTDVTIVTPQMIQNQLEMSEEDVDRLMDRLKTHGVITESSGRFLINREGLEATMRKFLGTKRKGSQREGNTKNPKRTREEHNDSEFR